ncbi:RNA polymerase sigma-70 factor (ECF subfamily) [Dyadobacter jejuensis]|uniref:RNA polymerase sigma-70 factor (ECF subfamily) n=1 Tax=Dyadobacter jejuensis TaxID=1082580 RepID=A0A316AJQ9_9BACT|nr:sigma-70 family RNA polymerase sigma factor [Dyadobacter jejuensis]PWJ58065.1 RNA polymerase sigma-70 factor (ECF subfamily) [Dyadobacter jejuensis]
MNTAHIWQQYHSELYSFVLQKVKHPDTAQDILQTSFIKIHQKIGQLKDPEKLKSWIFQIVRNEVYDHFKTRQPDIITDNVPTPSNDDVVPICCLDRFINQLPELYQAPMQLVYQEGKSQAEAAQIIDISLANLKARIRRAKAILIDQFTVCCKFEMNKDGKLIGEPDCAICDR